MHTRKPLSNNKQAPSKLATTATTTSTTPPTPATTTPPHQHHHHHHHHHRHHHRLPLPFVYPTIPLPSSTRKSLHIKPSVTGCVGETGITSVNSALQQPQATNHKRHTDK